MCQAVSRFREHYDQLGDMLYELLEFKEPQKRQVGQLLTSLEYENLMTALNLALTAQISFKNLYFPLSSYLDTKQDQPRGLELGQTVLSRLEKYPPDKLAGLLGYEFARVIDDIALRQLNLKQYEIAEASYQKVLSLLFNNQQFDADTIKKQSASIYHQLGRVAEGQRQWEQAREYFLQALENYKTYNDTHSGGMALSSLARLWQASGDANIPAAVATTLGAGVKETEKILREMLEEE